MAVPGDGAHGAARRGLPVLQPAGPGDPPTGERRDAAESRRRILATARRLFAARGVEAVSMHEIARAAGVGQGTLYRRYAHKGLLCAALLAESLRRFQEEVVAELGRGGPGAGAPALAQLDWFLARHVAFNEENAALLGAMDDAACGPRRHAIHGSPVYGWLHATATALLRRAMAAGEMVPADPDGLADAILAPLAIDLYRFQREERGYPPERIAATLRLLLDGLRTLPG
jgi:AcrR family transcriptional regulator